MPDVVLLGLALLAGCHFQACRTQGLFGQTEDWYIISTVRIEADSNKIDWVRACLVKNSSLIAAHLCNSF